MKTADKKLVYLVSLRRPCETNHGPALDGLRGASPATRGGGQRRASFPGRGEIHSPVWSSIRVGRCVLYGVGGLLSVMASPFRPDEGLRGRDSVDCWWDCPIPSSPSAWLGITASGFPDVPREAETAIGHRPSRPFPRTANRLPLLDGGTVPLQQADRLGMRNVPPLPPPISARRYVASAQLAPSLSSRRPCSGCRARNSGLRPGEQGACGRDGRPDLRHAPCDEQVSRRLSVGTARPRRRDHLPEERRGGCIVYPREGRRELGAFSRPPFAQARGVGRVLVCAASVEPALG